MCDVLMMGYIGSGSQDWEAMTSMLLDDKCGVVLNDEEESVLIEIMTCAAKRATSTATPSGRARGRVRLCIDLSY